MSPSCSHRPGPRARPGPAVAAAGLGVEGGGWLSWRSTGAWGSAGRGWGLGLCWSKKVTHCQVMLTWMQTTLVSSNSEIPQNSNGRNSELGAKLQLCRRDLNFDYMFNFYVFVPSPKYSGLHLLLCLP